MIDESNRPSDVTEAPLHLWSRAAKAHEKTMEHKAETLSRLSKQVSDLHSFVYGYTYIPEPSLTVRDDEIINWTFVDVCDDFSAACWNLACGFYKPAGTLLRSALDLGIAAAYFQTQESTNSQVFVDWDSGKTDTPKWDVMMDAFRNWPSVQRFDLRYGCSITREVRNQFRYLCNFTHSRAFAKQDGSPTNNMNMGVHAPEFHEGCFQRMLESFQSTVGWVATIWLVAFPTIIEAKPLGDPSILRSEYLNLLSVSRAAEALDFALYDVQSGHS